MKKNVGNADRLIRLIMAAIIVVLFFADKIGGTLAVVLLILAGIFLVTSIVGICPLYKLFGINTICKKV